MAAANKPSSGIIIPNRLTWHGKLAAFAIYNVGRILAATLRPRWDDQSGLLAPPSEAPVIFAVWHNRLAISMVFYHGYVRRHNPQARLAALISASKDGALFAAVMEHFQVQPVRGSSSRRGRQALLELTSWMSKGYHVAMTPDGPRGPRYRVQEGVIALAQITGRPIIPCSGRLNWKMRARSWDQFQIPILFSGCDIRFGAPINVPREITDEERTAFATELETRLMALTQD